MGTLNKSLAGIKWNFLINNFIYIIQVIQLILFAKILSPYDFSIIGIVVPIISAFFLISEFGFSASLVQKETNKIYEYASSVMIIMMLVTSIMSFMLISASGLIAEFYSNRELVYLIYFISIILLVKVYSSILTSLVIRNMDYQFECIGRLLGVVISFVISISILFVYKSYWAPVIPYLLTPFISSLFYLFKFKYTRLKLYFSLERVSEIFSFSYNLFFANLLFFFSRTGMGLVLAKLFPSNIYGSFYFAQQVSNYPRTFFSGIINKIVFSGLSSIQSDEVKFRTKFLEIGRVVTFFTSPIIFLLIYNAGTLFDVLFGAKWNEALPLFQYLMAFVLISIIGSIPALSLQAKGYANVILTSNIIRIPFLVSVIAYTALNNINIITFVQLFVIIELFPILYLIHKAIKSLEVPFLVFCLHYLKSSLVIIFSLILYNFIKVYFYFDELVLSLLGPLFIYLITYFFIMKKDFLRTIWLLRSVFKA